jgi:hypothetical protein
MVPIPRGFKALCWFCVGLTLSVCTYDLCLAQDLDELAPPDSLNIETDSLQVGDDLLLFDTPTDSLVTEGGRNIQPFYRKWWVWALVTTAIAVTAVLLENGQEKETEEDLPGFPDPPNR